MEQGFFEAIKERKDKIRAEIDTDSKVLNPFSTIIIRFYDKDDLLYEGETILKCDKFAGCFVCFNRDFSIITVEKGREKVSLPVSWTCLNWEGKPIFEDVYFETVKVGNLFVGRRKKYTLVYRYTSLEIEEGKGIFRIVLDKDKEFFTEEINYAY